MSLYKSNRWASEAKDAIDSIISSYEEADSDNSKTIDDLGEQIAELKAQLQAAREELADVRSELASMAEPEDPTSPFNR